MKHLKLKIIGESPLFPWKLGDVLVCHQFSLTADNIYSVLIGSETYLFEMKKSGIQNNYVFFEGFLTDTQENIGKIAFEVFHE